MARLPYWAPRGSSRRPTRTHNCHCGFSCAHAAAFQRHSRTCTRHLRPPSSSDSEDESTDGWESDQSSTVDDAEIAQCHEHFYAWCAPPIVSHGIAIDIICNMHWHY
jgi:hypothetical protein